MWNRTAIRFHVFAVSRIFRQLCCVHSHSLAVNLQPSTMLGFINKRTAITLFSFFPREGQEDKANQRLYFKFNLKHV